MEVIEDFVFNRPPEAPVFKPTVEEFDDPLVYIEKIKPIAEKFGICKIKPPQDWKPPFSVNPSTFKFNPRVQKLNELEAQTRIKLNFHDKLARFWELQGIKHRIPNVGRKMLDLHKLNKVVLEEGGFHKACADKKWNFVAKRLNYDNHRCLKQHYEKILLPYDLFISGESFQHLKQSFDREESKVVPKTPSPAKRRTRQNPDTTNNQASGAQSATNCTTPVKKSTKTEEEIEADDPGPPKLVKATATKRKSKKNKSIDHYMCMVCEGGDHEEKMLLCDGCDDAYHLFCLTPPLTDVPKGEWRCPHCLALVYYRPAVDFGFDQSRLYYTLENFGLMADKFKTEYFNMPLSKISRSLTEQHFWYLVGSLKGEICVEYGADLSAGEVGSGFPTADNRKNLADLAPELIEKYTNSPWNLNNLSANPKSVLKHIDVPISGMKVPWCYVGMCFSCFCWHIEDHWSYSINYLHRGEPKTWYGVSSDQADRFEQVMREQAPELFDQSPDLLHHITTIMNPNTLQERGVNIYRTDQLAGEFVVTFPRAYHAGFNQGFNFAEAVNFCPADWLPFGRTCIANYAKENRRCVFSHDEIVCGMAQNPDDLTSSLLFAVKQEMERMHSQEKVFRKNALKRGVRHTEKEDFERWQDDERQCQICGTTIYLSALGCPCSPTKLICLSHETSLCSCPYENKVLRYRFGLDELNGLVKNIEAALDFYDNWDKTVHRVLQYFSNSEKLSKSACAAKKSKSGNARNNNTELSSPTKEPKQENGNEIEEKPEIKPTFKELDDLINIAISKNYPVEKIDLLQKVRNDVQKAMQICKDLFAGPKPRRTRNQQQSRLDSVLEVKKLTLEEFQQFCVYLEQLPCQFEEQIKVKELAEQIAKWQRKVSKQLVDEDPDLSKLNSLVDYAEQLDVKLPEQRQLNLLMERVEWLHSVKEALNKPKSITLQEVAKFLEDGAALESHTKVNQTRQRLKRILNSGENIEAKALDILKAKQGQYAIFTVQSVISEALLIEAHLPHVEKLEDLMSDVAKITKELDEIKQLTHQRIYPLGDTVTSLLEKCERLPISFPGIKELESSLAYLEDWRSYASSLFLKKGSTHSLLEVLLPRPSAAFQHLNEKAQQNMSFAITGKKGGRKTGAANKSAEMSANKVNCQIFEKHWREVTPSTEAVCSDIYSNLAEEEITCMRNLRELNMRKGEMNDADEALYCHCRRAGVKGIMVQCELCKDWFHEQCVVLPKSENIHYAKFLCPLCERTHRPNLETTVRDLIEKLCLDVNIRFPEVDALQLLAHRALNFQRKVHRLISRDKDLRRAFSDYSRIMEVRVPGNKNLPPPTNNPLSTTQANQGSMPSAAIPMDCPIIRDSTVLSHMDNRFKDSYEAANIHGKKQTRKSPHSMLRTVGSSVGSSSTLSQLSPLSPHIPDYLSSGPVPPTNSTPSTNRDERTSLAPVQQAKENSKKLQNLHLELPEDVRDRLEVLMLEGDLLEVSVPETTWLWHMYVASADMGYNIKEKEAKKNSAKISSKSSVSSQISNKTDDIGKRRGSGSRLSNRRQMQSQQQYAYSSSSSDSSFSEFANNPIPKPKFKRNNVDAQPVTGKVIKKYPQFPSYSDYSDNDEPQQIVSPNSNSYSSSQSQNSSFCMDNQIVSSSKYGKKRKSEESVGSSKMLSKTKLPTKQPKQGSNTIKSGRRLVSQLKVKTERKSQPKPAAISNKQRHPSGDTSKKSLLKSSAPIKRRLSNQSSNSTTRTNNKKLRSSDTNTANNQSSVRKKNRVCNDDCKAEVCKQPVRNKVDWVMCDDCEQWYHWVCVGITSDDQIPSHYSCPSCFKDEYEYIEETKADRSNEDDNPEQTLDNSLELHVDDIKPRATTPQQQQHENSSPPTPPLPPPPSNRPNLDESQKSLLLLAAAVDEHVDAAVSSRISPKIKVELSSSVVQPELIVESSATVEQLESQDLDYGEPPLLEKQGDDC